MKSLTEGGTAVLQRRGVADSAPVRVRSSRLGALGVVTLAGTTMGQIMAPIPPRILDDMGPVHPGAPVVACFTKGTDPRYIEAVSGYLHLKNQAFFGHDYHLGTRWSGAQGSPRALTWSFVPDGLMISSGSGEPASPSDLFATMDAGFASQGGRAVWVGRFQDVFARYAQLTGNTFTRVQHLGNDWDDGAGWGSAGFAGLRGDFRISMHLIDGPGGGIGAYNYYPPNGDMVIDSADINSLTPLANAHRGLRNLVAHEIGHGLGLQHTCSSNSAVLMSPFGEYTVDGPRQDDIRGVQGHYGDPFEPNDTAGTATALGALSPGAAITRGAIPAPVAGSNDANAALCSIDAAGEQDWFSFSVSGAQPVTIVVTPVGSTYDDSAQAGNGSCPSGNPINAKAVADLVLTLYSTNGTTVLSTANATAAGFAETITSYPLAAAGTYYVRISESNTPSSTQLYTLSIAADCVVVPLMTSHPSPQTVYNGSNAIFTSSASNAVTYRWRKNGVDLFDDGRIYGAATGTLFIGSVRSSDQAVYSLRATGACAVAQSLGAQLTVVCYPNCDGSTASPVLNISDFTCFMNSYLSATGYANCDGSTTPPVHDVRDFICFQTRFAAGCP